MTSDAPPVNPVSFNQEATDRAIDRLRARLVDEPDLDPTSVAGELLDSGHTMFQTCWIIKHGFCISITDARGAIAGSGRVRQGEGP